MAPQTWYSRGSGLGCLAARSPCQCSLGSVCRAIAFVQLQNSFLKVVFPSIWHTSSKYSIQHEATYLCKLCAKQMSKIWWKNIHVFLRYSDFCDGVFYFASPCIRPAHIQGTFNKFQDCTYFSCTKLQ